MTLVNVILRAVGFNPLRIVGRYFGVLARLASVVNTFEGALYTD